MTTLLRARILSFSGEPGRHGHDYLDDGVIEIDGGLIRSVQPAAAFADAGNSLDQCEDLRPAIVMPGFIDTHIHFPQLNIMASYGTQLMEWLERYAFPAETAFADRAYAESQVEPFLTALYEAGTTSAVAFTSVHPHTTDILMQAAHARGMRLIAGKVLMDRHAPEALLDAADHGIPATRQQIERWHGTGRLSYAVTPRFAVTSTPEQLAAAGALAAEFPGVYVHSHLAENPGEIAEVERLFPGSKSYTHVYDQFGLLTERSVYAHGIHLSDDERALLASRGAAIAFCPTSNLFLGSGLLDIDKFKAQKLAVATDVGGGTSYSMLTTLGDGYKVCQLNGISWAPLEALYAATLGNAHALGLGDVVGRIAPGYEADLIALAPDGIPALKNRVAHTNTLDEELFAYIMLGDERAIARTWVNGAPVVGG